MIPIVEGVATVNDGCRTVKIDCPYCGRKHTHGWPLGGKGQPGHRVSHCLQKQPGDVGYEIVVSRR